MQLEKKILSSKSQTLKPRPTEGVEHLLLEMHVVVTHISRFIS